MRGQLCPVKYSWYSNRPVRGTARTAIARVLDAESRGEVKQEAQQLQNNSLFFRSWYLVVVNAPGKGEFMLTAFVP